MIITTKPKKTEKVVIIPFNEIPVGHVYVVKYYDGPIALKLKGNNAVLLCDNEDDTDNRFEDDTDNRFENDTDNRFEIADGFKGEPAYKVLGELTEIIVEEV